MCENGCSECIFPLVLTILLTVQALLSAPYTGGKILTFPPSRAHLVSFWHHHVLCRLLFEAVRSDLRLSHLRPPVPLCGVWESVSHACCCYYAALIFSGVTLGKERQNGSKVVEKARDPELLCLFMHSMTGMCAKYHLFRWRLAGMQCGTAWWDVLIHILYAVQAVKVTVCMYCVGGVHVNVLWPLQDKRLIFSFNLM